MQVQPPKSSHRVMSFTGIEVVLLSLDLFLATRGKDGGAFMNEEMMCCCNEDNAVELLAVTTVVIASLPSNGVVSNSISISISITSNISPEGNKCRSQMYSPLFERTWLKVMMACPTACSWYSNSIPMDCQFRRTRHHKTDHQRRAEKTVGCGTHLATSRATSFTIDPSPYVDRVALLTATPLTLTAAKGQPVATRLPTG